MISDNPGIQNIEGRMQYYRYRCLFLALIIALMTGCSSISSPSEDPPALRLLPPLSAPEQVLKQKVLLQAQEIEREFLLISRLTPENIIAVVLLPTGQTLLQLKYDGQNFSQQVFLPGDVPGHELLAIMQFSVWPEQIIRDRYNAVSGWHTAFSEDMRSLSWKNQLLLQVEREAGQLTVMNNLHGYRVVIKDLESDR